MHAVNLGIASAPQSLLFREQCSTLNPPQSLLFQPTTTGKIYLFPQLLLKNKTKQKQNSSWDTAPFHCLLNPISGTSHSSFHMTFHFLKSIFLFLIAICNPPPPPANLYFSSVCLGVAYLHVFSMNCCSKSGCFIKNTLLLYLTDYEIYLLHQDCINIWAHRWLVCISKCDKRKCKNTVVVLNRPKCKVCMWVYSILDTHCRLTAMSADLTVSNKNSLHPMFRHTYPNLKAPSKVAGHFYPHMRQQQSLPMHTFLQ